MRHMLLALVLLAAAGAPARAQEGRPIEIGGVWRTDRVAIEGGQHGLLPVAGVALSLRVRESLRLEVDLTQASGSVGGSYEGAFVSFAGEGATREEIERLSVVARRTTVHDAGTGGTFGVALRVRENRRASLVLRGGLAFRRYAFAETTTVLRVPSGVTLEEAQRLFVDVSRSRTRGGLLAGVGLPMQLADRLVVTPEVRWVWGGPARVGNNYDEVSIGVRAGWTF